jgi:hypothetical protein
MPFCHLIGTYRIRVKIACAGGAPPKMKTDYTRRGTVPVTGRI